MSARLSEPHRGNERSEEKRKLNAFSRNWRCEELRSREEEEEEETAANAKVAPAAAPTAEAAARAKEERGREE